MAQGQIRNRGKRRDGSTKWEARYWDRTQPGLRHQKVFRTKQQAQDWLLAQMHSQLNGTHTSPSQGNTPFQVLAETFLQSLPHIEPRTRSGYEQILRTHLLPEFGHVPIREITPARVQHFVSCLSQRREPGTVRNVYACLHNALNTAVRLRMIPTNPCVGIRLPRSQREEMLFLNPAEIQLLATAIAEPRPPSDKKHAPKTPTPPRPSDRVLVLTAAYTGLRAGELLALRRQDVDLLHGRIFVRRSLKKETLTFGPTKTHTHRTVSLPKFLRELLETHLSSPHLLADPDALVFPSVTDPAKPMRHDLWYRRHFKPAVRRALPSRLHGLRFHDLRHTCASLLIAQGVHAKAIQERLGHSSISITMDRYGHLMESAYQSVADALDAAFLAPRDETGQNVTAIR